MIDWASMTTPHFRQLDTFQPSFEAVHSCGLLGITDLRDKMAVQMEGEFSITKNFVKFYMPFEPADDDVNALYNQQYPLPLRSQLCATPSKVSDS
jgi:hypothetical protein